MMERAYPPRSAQAFEAANHFGLMIELMSLRRGNTRLRRSTAPFAPMPFGCIRRTDRRQKEPIK